MKILELCLSKSLGGLELYFFRCSQYFAKQGMSLAVVCQGSKLDNKLTSEGIQSFQLGTSLLKNISSLLQIIKASEIDILHVHHKADLFLCALVKLLSKKKFRLVHTRQMQMPHKKKDPYHRFIYSRMDLFIAITKQLQDAAISNLPIEKSKIITLYYGVPEPQLSSESPFNEKESRFKIGLFSRINRKKGQHTFIEACQYLEKNSFIAQLYGGIMNEEYYEGLLRVISKNKLDNEIVFQGFHENPPSLMGHFDVIIMPSLDETFGLVAIEAMRAGTPVIAANFGGLTEIIRHDENGLLFEKENAKDLAKQIQYLMDNPEQASKIAIKGKQDADRNFSETIHFEKLHQLFLGVLKN